MIDDTDALVDRAKLRRSIDGLLAVRGLAAAAPDRDTWGLLPEHADGEARASALLGDE